MTRQENIVDPLIVALGEQAYRVERPWGDLPAGTGRVTDVACDHRGHVFVLLRKDPYIGPPEPAVIELSPTGERLAAWGEAVADAHSLTAAPDGRIFVVDRDAHEIIIFSPDGERLGGLGRRHSPNAPFCHPTDVAFAPSGDIYISDGYGASRIHRFSHDGAYLGLWGTPGSGDGQFMTPHALWVTPDGCVAVVDRENDRVQRFTATGAFIVSWTGFHRPAAIWGNRDGTLYITDAIPRLTRIASDGAMTGRCRPVLNGSHGFSSDGSHLFCAEGNPSRLSRLTPIGAHHG